jgi:nitrogen PTS system EIIA component
VRAVLVILEQISHQVAGVLRDLIKWFNKGCAVKISNYLDVQLIVFLNASTRDEALEALITELHRKGKIKDKGGFYKAILEREKIVSTGIGMGIAVPHAKLKDLSQFFIAVGIQKTQGLEWNALDKAPVRIVFMIGGPEDKQTEYLQILSRLTHTIKDEDLRKKLLKAQNAAEVMKLLSGS